MRLAYFETPKVRRRDDVQEMTFDFKGQTAIVTGGASGIARGVAVGLAIGGADVVVGDIEEEGIRALEDTLKREGLSVLAVPTDVTSTSDVERLTSRAVEIFGGIDILVTAAGGFSARIDMENISDEVWEQSLSLNLSSVFRCCRAVVTQMKKQDRGGRIVTVSSAAGRTPVTTTAAHYAASKAGVLGFTRHLARELGKYGITVNAVAPGATKTPRLDAMYSPEHYALISDLTPLGRIAQIDEQVGPILFLASEHARYMTGATLDVNGGRVML